MAHHREGGSTADTRNALDDKLKDVTGKFLSKLETSFTAIADCDSTAPCIFDAFVSQSRVPYGCRCVGRISHQLNTAVKHAMSSKVVSSKVVGRDFKAVKTTVTLFKLASLDSDLPPDLRWFRKS